jgi:hypothetical protein
MRQQAAPESPEITRDDALTDRIQTIKNSDGQITLSGRPI